MIHKQHCNKRALVTGSSRGIGRAIAIGLAQEGYEVLVHCARNVDKAEETKTVIEAQGGKADILIADLCDANAVKEMTDHIRDVDVLVLNASLQIRRKWPEITLEECYDQLNCNLVSSLVLIQAVAPYMKEKKWGRIISIGSVQEKKPHPDMLIYSASKAAQTNMIQSLALQLAQDGITVNNIAPGVIYTDRNAEVLSKVEYKAMVVAEIPVGYYGKPEDIVGTIKLLCSEEGRYITGQSIYVDGGYSI